MGAPARLSPGRGGWDGAGLTTRGTRAGAPPLLVVLDVAALLAVAALVDRKARAGGTRAATVAR